MTNYKPKLTTALLYEEGASIRRDDKGNLTNFREKVTIYKGHSTLKEASEKGLLICAECGERLLYRRWREEYRGPRKRIQPHFAHYGEGCGYGESWQHHLAKTHLSKLLKKHNRRKNYHLNVRTEVSTDPNIPDIFLEWIPKYDWLFPLKVAVEIQCSPLYPGYMMKKINNNTDQDIHTLYIFNSGDGRFLKRNPSDQERRRVIRPAEKYWRKLSNYLYYFEATPTDEDEDPEIKFYGAVLDDIKGLKLLKNRIEWEEIENFRLGLGDYDTGPQTACFEWAKRNIPGHALF